MRTKTDGFVLKQTETGERSDGWLRLDFTETEKWLRKEVLLFDANGERAADGFHWVSRERRADAETGFQSSQRILGRRDNEQRTSSASFIAEEATTTANQ
uniref:Uncharacterized protein n=1 Tax=Cucumis melo TaxID=3656 RepID=A0A9I9DCA9_CUCME